MKFDVTISLFIITYDKVFNSFYISEENKIEINNSIDASLKISLNSFLKDAQSSKKLLSPEFVSVKETDNASLSLYYYSLIPIEQTDINPRLFRSIHKFSKGLERLTRSNLVKHYSEFDKQYYEAFIGKKFTIESMFDIYKSLVNYDIEKGNFHRLLKSLDLLEDTGELLEGVSYRPPKLYRFK
ncbi:MAG: hypothetical protein Q9M91_01120 [Candidatus Dojkabacteria bacterium]|nr:hypothetical protein [Candidatus Dojkabacteria bacterium]MDQ7020426.1 hypothetical protein [Candidatus Dojkabacteria bacterium]